MKRIAQKFGIMLMLAASLAVAGHIFQHCLANPPDTLINCSVCQSIMASSVHAATPDEVEFVFLCAAIQSITPDHSSLHNAADQSRAPPPVFFS